MITEHANAELGTPGIHGEGRAPAPGVKNEVFSIDGAAAVDGNVDVLSLSDEALVDRVRAGDRAAFDDLYNRYFKRIYSFLDRRLSNRADTEETTQEVFINVFSSLDSFRGDAPFVAWLFGLTRRTLAGRFKRKRHVMVPIIEEDEDRLSANVATGRGGPSIEPDPLENYEMAERAEHLLHALTNDLSASQRRIFEMHHLESISIAEIASQLSKTEDSIKSSLYRSRKILLDRS